LATVPLFLPGVLWVIGLHQLAVILGLDGTFLGLLAAHTLAAIPYVLISLTPAYLGFDPRYAHVSQSLGRSPLTTLVRIKWPILRASLAFSFAVGVSVSITQFVTTLYIGAGRTETVTTQAVALSSGGARNVMAAYATLQWILMTMAFAAAAALGRARFSNQHA
jgi:putative thiamine transport system permease protein